MTLRDFLSAYDDNTLVICVKERDDINRLIGVKYDGDTDLAMCLSENLLYAEVISVSISSIETDRAVHVTIKKPSAW